MSRVASRYSVASQRCKRRPRLVPDLVVCAISSQRTLSPGDVAAFTSWQMLGAWSHPEEVCRCLRAQSWALSLVRSRFHQADSFRLSCRPASCMLDFRVVTSGNRRRLSAGVAERVAVPYDGIMVVSIRSLELRIRKHIARRASEVRGNIHSGLQP